MWVTRLVSRGNLTISLITSLMNSPSQDTFACKLQTLFLNKLRGSVLVKIKISDMANAGVISAGAIVLQQKTGSSVRAIYPVQPA